MLRIFLSRQSRYPADSKSIKKNVKELLLDRGVTSAEISIVIVGERKMKELGITYLKETATDPVHEVLSFPAQERATEGGINFQEKITELDFGDIFICYPEARKIAIKKNRMMDDVLIELAVHGTQHLLGEHHD